MAPRLLDLFCGAGGAAMGYHRAGFEVVGVDIKPQPRYPFRFWQADAMELLREGWPLDAFDVVHASPPCQEYSSALGHLITGEYPKLIEPVREALIRQGLPWVIENVPGAPLPSQDTLEGRYGLMLCGTMFDLRVRRHRLFEASHRLAVPPAGCNHRNLTWGNHGPAQRERMRSEDGTDRYYYQSLAEEYGLPHLATREALEAEVDESIPAPYTEWIGHQFMQHVKVAA